MKNHLLLIIGMALVTYFPRLLPLVALSDRRVNRNIREFCTIYYTSLSILIIKGIMTAGEGMKIATIAGIGIAGILSYKKKGI